MVVRGVVVEAGGDGGATGGLTAAEVEALREVAARRTVALVGAELPAVESARGRSPADPGPFVVRLSAAALGLDPADPRLLTMAAAGCGCHPNELVAVGTQPRGLVEVVRTLGGRGVWWNPTGAEPPRGAHPDAVVAALAELPAVLDGFDGAARAEVVGVGPHPEPWPDDDRLDPALLAAGDRRNVVDRYRYWREEAVAADLARRAHGFHVAVENWRRDRNIGTVVRNANGFGAAAVHVVGARRWNRRGAMATDRYLDVRHHSDVDGFLAWAAGEGLPIVAVDNVAGSVPIEATPLPARCVLVFGQEGPGLGDGLLARADLVVRITQHGSTRSLNAGVASGIAMFAWALQHARPDGTG